MAEKDLEAPYMRLPLKSSLKMKLLPLLQAKFTPRKMQAACVMDLT